MFRISKDSPVYYLTSVANNRLPVFQKAKLKNVACNALNEARTSAGLLIFAYVIMPDHLHALIGSQRTPSEVLRYVNGISGHRVINVLKEKCFDSSLQKLKRESGNRRRRSLETLNKFRKGRAFPHGRRQSRAPALLEVYLQRPTS